MRVTKELRAVVSRQGAKGLIEICESELIRLVNKLKVASAEDVKKLQGNIETLEFLIKFKSSN